MPCRFRSNRKRPARCPARTASRNVAKPKLRSSKAGAAFLTYCFTFRRYIGIAIAASVAIITITSSSSRSVKPPSPEAERLAGTFKRSALVFGDKNETVLKLAADSQIVPVYGTDFRSTPVFFLHYWGTGPAEKLASGFKAALDQLEKGKSAPVSR